MPTDVGEVVQLHDNTAVKGLRSKLTDDYKSFTERSDRLKAAVQDAIGEFQKETREGMSNRQDDGFSNAEARKYAKATVEIFELVSKGLAAIKNNTKRDLEAIIGSNALVENSDGTMELDATKIGGILGTMSIGVEQDQLKYVSFADSVDVVEGDEPPKTA